MLLGIAFHLMRTMKPKTARQSTNETRSFSAATQPTRSAIPSSSETWVLDPAPLTRESTRSDLRGELETSKLAGALSGELLQ